ncbi:copper resistance CopC family protein [Bacillus tuaregi]|uniref:copper resistance CopC family protein n=1 Tax=Bacillus tuaregi TaxID=1816695 RepID=UPI0008F963E4|nr:copper resistance protein CopC [Bacillus tuaregi]
MKKISILTFVFFLLFIENALAHTGLGSSFPEDGAVIKEELQTITLTFETKIEQGSLFKLENSVGESLPVENITLSENQLTGNLLDSLENGEYRIIWNIIGADGHPVDGALSFSVDKVAEEPSVDDDPAISEQTETKTEKAESQEKAEESNETEQNDGSSYTVPILVGVLAVIIAACIFWVVKRKK